MKNHFSGRYVNIMKRNLFRLILTICLAIVSFSAVAREKEQKVALGVWDDIPKEATVEDLTEWMKPLVEAGITQFYMCGSPESTERFIKASKNYKGTKVHAWIHVMNVPGDSVAYQHPEWFDVNRIGFNSLEYDPYVKHYKWLSPSQPEAREYVKGRVAEFAALDGLESVHLDYIRYSDALLGRSHQVRKFKMEQDSYRAELDFGYHPVAIEKFKSIFGYSPLDITAPWLHPEWQQFRLNELNTLVDEMIEATHAAGKKVSAAVFPFPLRARMTVYQDWTAWNLDIVCPMNYQRDFMEGPKWVEFCVEQGIRETGHRMEYISGIAVGQISDEALVETVDLSIKAGADGINFFNARSLFRNDRLEIVKKINEKYNTK